VPGDCPSGTVTVCAKYADFRNSHNRFLKSRCFACIEIRPEICSNKKIPIVDQIFCSNPHISHKVIIVIKRYQSGISECFWHIRFEICISCTNVFAHMYTELHTYFAQSNSLLKSTYCKISEFFCNLTLEILISCTNMHAHMYIGLYAQMCIELRQLHVCSASSHKHGLITISRLPKCLGVYMCKCTHVLIWGGYD